MCTPKESLERVVYSGMQRHWTCSRSRTLLITVETLYHGLYVPQILEQSVDTTLETQDCLYDYV